MFYYMIAIGCALQTITSGARLYGPTTPDHLKCRYGRYQADLSNTQQCDPRRPNSCVDGYNCQGGLAYQPGPCCKAVNPCKVGDPFARDGDAPNCIKNGVSRCPTGYNCVGTKQTSSVCCKGCTYEGKSRFPSENFYNSRGGDCTCGYDGEVTCVYHYCPYKNDEHPIGTVFDDGCKTCTCNTNGQVTCTDKYCSVYCHHGGQQYTYGQPKFPKGDGCNECSCQKDGTVICTSKPCIVYCHHGGQQYTYGQPKFPKGDGCNECSCQKDGTVSCTNNPCVVYCRYSGRQYSPGRTFPSTDGCNQCSCQQDGQVICGEAPCNSYPGNNPYAG